MMWPEQDPPIEGVFDEAVRAARPWCVRITHQEQPCMLHTEPGPEMWHDPDGTEHLVTDGMREAWDREGGSLVIRRTYVGTCHTNGYHPNLPAAEQSRHV